MNLSREFSLEHRGRAYRAESYRPQHVEAVEALEKLCFSDPWSRKLLAQEAAEEGRRWNLVLLDEEGPAAYSFVWHVEDELHLLNYAVRPALQGLGLGRAFLRRLIAEGRRAGFGLLTLEVRESNAPALRLYSGEGMVVLLKRSGYYSDTGEDALVMALPLQDFGEEAP